MSYARELSSNQMRYNNIAWQHALSFQLLDDIWSMSSTLRFDTSAHQMSTAIGVYEGITGCIGLAVGGSIMSFHYHVRFPTWSSVSLAFFSLFYDRNDDCPYACRQCLCGQAAFSLPLDVCRKCVLVHMVKKIMARWQITLYIFGFLSSSSLNGQYCLRGVGRCFLVDGQPSRITCRDLGRRSRFDQFGLSSSLWYLKNRASSQYSVIIQQGILI